MEGLSTEHELHELPTWTVAIFWAALFAATLYAMWGRPIILWAIVFTAWVGGILAKTLYGRVFTIKR